MGESDQHVSEDFQGFLIPAKAGDNPVWVVLQNLHGISLVDFHTRHEHLGIEVVGTFFDQRAALESFDKLFDLRNFEADDLFDLDILVEEDCLADSSWEAIEQQQLLRGEVAIRGDESMDIMVPNLNGNLVRQKKTFSGVMLVELAGRGLGGETAEDVARREMEMIACTAEEFSEGALTGAWWAEDQDATEGFRMFWDKGLFFHENTLNRGTKVYRKRGIKARGRNE